jgi:hypothetical protein
VATVATAAPSAHGGALGLATLLCWLFTASFGAYMLRSLAARGALREQRSVRDGLSPRVLYTHFSLALTGLVTWAAFLATGWGPLAWVAVTLLTPAIGLGICTVTLWTPYPRPTGDPGPAAEDPAAPDPGRRGRGSQGAVLFPPPAHDAVRGRLTDATLARALTDEALAARLIDEVIASLPAAGAKRARKPRVYPAAVIPFGHGLGALATFVLAVVTAIGTR